MEIILHILLIIPVLGLILSTLMPGNNEKLISGSAFFTVGIHFVAFMIFTFYWLWGEHKTINIKDFVLLKTGDYEFFIDFCFDKVSATFLFVGSFLTFLVTVYSRAYLHREKGYKRFYTTILLFYLGYNIAIFSGNMETLFIGWEMLGICSFLLIAFYRDRYLPVRNALKVFTVYRIGDVGILLAIWMSHHLWHENITFQQLNNQELVHEHLQNHSLIGVFISAMILLTAAVKSAQLPFTSWLPRAMEGPTPSSAIFYGSLSVHLGVFLLMRTFPFWENQLSIRIIIAVLGLGTSIVGSLIARVQSSVKTQIAYASVSQIGLMFIEVAAGFETFALFHFAGNAFLRTYQLLVSPSVVSYLIREQFYNFVPRKATIEDSLPKKFEYSFYLLSVKEWNLDSFVKFWLWDPLKWMGRKLDFVNLTNLFYFFVPAYVIGLMCLYGEDYISEEIIVYLPYLFSLIGLAMVLKAFSERKSVMLSWLLIIMSHFWTALAVSFNEHFKYAEVYLYLSGVVLSGVIGSICIWRIQKLENRIDMNQFYGHLYEHPKIGVTFLLCCIGLMGFPITPTFIGEDLLFSHIHQNQFMLAVFSSMSFIIAGLALFRMYARVFLGPHIKTYHEVPYRSS
jgi:NADH-quinone oxidoreductase subunit L